MGENEKDWAGTWIERPQTISLSSLDGDIWSTLHPPAKLEVLHLFRWFTHTHLLRTIFANSDVECILRATTLQLHLTGMGGWKDPRKFEKCALAGTAYTDCLWFSQPGLHVNTSLGPLTHSPVPASAKIMTAAIWWFRIPFQLRVTWGASKNSRALRIVADTKKKMGFLPPPQTARLWSEQSWGCRIHAADLASLQPCNLQSAGRFPAHVLIQQWAHHMSRLIPLRDTFVPQNSTWHATQAISSSSHAAGDWEDIRPSSHMRPKQLPQNMLHPAKSYKSYGQNSITTFLSVNIMTLAYSLPSVALPTFRAEPLRMLCASVFSRGSEGRPPNRLATCQTKRPLRHVTF